MKISRHFLTISACIGMTALSVTAVMADVVSEARALLDEGNYTQALSMIQERLAARPKAGEAASLQSIAGMAHYYLGNREEAESNLEKARARSVPEAWLYSARLAMEDYQFGEAADMYSRYLSLADKAGKDIDPTAEIEEQSAQSAADMLERVEQIIVIDRIEVDADKFFSYYRLSPESGHLTDIEKIRDGYPNNQDIADAQSPVFENERRDFRLWSQPDTTADSRLVIMESNRYIGGGWESPTPSDSVLNGGGNAAYPFMMADGTTLYFASDGNGSIGGYDIFRSNRDSETASYQAPVNVGMPYNSPYNDYMLAIDESTDIGWWASDRDNLDDGKISIYVYIPNELRRNYETDTDNIEALARLDDIEATHGEEDVELIEATRSRLDALMQQKDDSHRAFDFPISDGIIYHNINDFHSPEAAQLMRQWLREQQEFSDLQQELSELRHQFASHRGDRQYSTRILNLEKRYERTRLNLNRTRGRIIAAENAASE